MPRGHGHASHHRGTTHHGYSHGYSHGSYGYSHGSHGYSSYGSSSYHRRGHNSGFRSAPVYVTKLQTPSQAAWEEANEEIRLFYTPSGRCPGALPYFGGFLTLVSFALILASILVPWYYVGGAQKVTPLARSSRFFGYAVGLSQLEYCESYSPFTGTSSSSSSSSGETSASEWFDSYSCSPAAYEGNKSLSTSAFQAAVGLSSLSLATHVASLVYPCTPRCCKGFDLRPAATSASMTLAHLRVLSLKLIGALLALSGLLAGTLGLPSDDIFKALSSPKPGILEGPGVTLIKVGSGFAFAALGSELGFLLGTALHFGRVKALGYFPAPPPTAPSPPTELQQRALEQGQAMLTAGHFAALSPQPILPEDLRAYGVPNISKRGGGASAATHPPSGPLSQGPEGGEGVGCAAGMGALDLYYCRQRMYSGAQLHEDTLPSQPPPDHIKPDGAAAAGGTVGAVEVVSLVLSTGLRSKQRVKVRLGEDGSLLAPAGVGSGGVWVVAAATAAAAAAAAGGPPPTAVAAWLAPPSGMGVGVGGGGYPLSSQQLPPPTLPGQPPKFCPACGTPVGVTGAHFCASCGVPLQ